jgi:hypothetical protein
VGEAGWLLVLLVLGVVGVFSIASERGRRRRWEEALGLLAQHVDGLVLEPRRPWSRVTGRVQGFEVEVATSGDSNGQSTRIEVAAGLPRSLNLRVEHGLDFGADVQAGIHAFDQRFRLAGRRDIAVLARLGDRTRQAMWAAVHEHGVSIRDGVIRWRTQGTVLDADKLKAVVPAMIELAAALRQHGDRPAVELLHHAFEDPDLLFRRRCLEALLDSLRQSPEAEQALERAEQDPDPGIRYLAARERGDLDAIHALVDSGELPSAMRSGAIMLLGPRYGGGLSIADEGQEGGLSLQADAEGALSEAREAEPPPRRPAKKQRQ